MTSCRPPKHRRYERKAPGELIHTDIKKLAKIDGVGHRIHGDRTQGSGKGWEYLHVAIDDHSRLAYSEVLPDESGDSSLNLRPQHREVVCGTRYQGAAYHDG